MSEGSFIYTHIRGKEALTDSLPAAYIEPGSRVRLHWYGDKNVPLWLNHSWATVLRITKQGNLVIQADGETTNERSISPQRHVSEVKQT